MYYSLMHYSSSAFTANGRYTILKNDGGTIAYPTEMSAKDVYKINTYYTCKTTVTEPTEPTVDEGTYTYIDRL